jgi:hypothetical protein
LSSGSSVRFEGVLVLSVEGSSSFSERCILKGRNILAFKCSLLQLLTEYLSTIPYGSKVNAEYWGDGQKIVEKELGDLLHFHSIQRLRK